MPRTPNAVGLAALIAVAVGCAAGCGGQDAAESKKPAVVREGAVVFRDPLDDNDNGWFVVEDLLFFRGGRYEWQKVPKGREASIADAVVNRPLPSGISISATVTARQGAALRGLACRELGPPEKPVPEDWYELGIDGRRALLRRVHPNDAAAVLNAASLPIPNGRPVRLTGQCVPDADGGLVLALRVDGREVVRARDPEPLPATRDGVEGTPSLFAYKRPDTDRPPVLAWDDFVIRKATLAPAGGD